MVSGNPCRMHHSRPGEMRSFTLSMFWSVIRSPGETSACAGGPDVDSTRAAAAASAHQDPLLVIIVLTPWRLKTDGAAGSSPAAPSADLGSSSRPSVPRVHQRRDREPVVGDAGLLALVEVPALLAREAVARQGRLGGVLELHVDHDDGGYEPHLVGIVDDVGALERLLPEAHVVDPDLPELPRPVVDVRERDDPRLLVDEDHTLPVGVLRELRDALDDVDLPLLPHVVEGPVDLVVPLHRIVLRVVAADQVALAEELEVHPGRVAAVAVVAVDVGVLAEQRVRALRGRKPADPAERRQVEPRIVLLLRRGVTVAERADALQVEGLEDRV